MRHISVLFIFHSTSLKSLSSFVIPLQSTCTAQCFWRPLQSPCAAQLLLDSSSINLRRSVAFGFLFNQPSTLSCFWIPLQSLQSPCAAQCFWSPLQSPFGAQLLLDFFSANFFSRFECAVAIMSLILFS